MSVKLWINRNKIYLSIYIGGKRWRESTGLTVTTDKAQNKVVMDMAEVLRSKREVSLIAVSNGLSDPALTKITVLEYVKNAAAEKNKKHPLHKVVLWIEKISPTLKMDALTPTWFENFQQTLQRETELSPYTCENYVLFLKRP